MTDTEALDVALALLFLVTGEEWDRTKLSDQSANLRELATQALLRKGLSRYDAETFVAERWSAYAADNPVPTAAVAEKPIGDITAGVSLGTVRPEAPSVNDLAARAAARRARKAQEA